MSLERFLNKIAGGMDRLRGRVIPLVYGIETGRGTRIGRLCVIRGGEGITFGDGVSVTEQSWLNVVDRRGRIGIGNRVGLGRRTTISAAEWVEVGDETIFGPNVLVTDHNHQYGAPSPVSRQGITTPKPVRIGRGCWVGANSVILPGTVLPDYSVVAANSVVGEKSTAGCGPDPVVIAGAPAKVVRKMMGAWASSRPQIGIGAIGGLEEEGNPPSRRDLGRTKWVELLPTDSMLGRGGLLKWATVGEA